MAKVTLYIGHPNLKDSIYLKKLIGAIISEKDLKEIIEKGSKAAEFGGHQIHFRYLTGLYPKSHGMIYCDMKDEIQVEQEILGKETDIIVFMFPIIWYGMPAALKSLMDNVFTEGFAFCGCNPSFLKHKGFACAFTCGTPTNVYTEGTNGITLDEVSIPFSSFARFTGMEFIHPYSLCSGDFCPLKNMNEKETELEKHEECKAKKCIKDSSECENKEKCQEHFNELISEFKKWITDLKIAQ